MLVGANASGKSNLLDAIRVLHGVSLNIEAGVRLDDAQMAQALRIQFETLRERSGPLAGVRRALLTH